MSVETMAIVLHHSRARGTDKVVLLGIANHDGDGGAWPSLATLTKYANVTKRKVQEALRRLEAAGEIRTLMNAGGTHCTAPHERPNRYEVLVCCPPDCDGTKNHKQRQGGDARIRGGMPQTSGGGMPQTSGGGDAANVRGGGCRKRQGGGMPQTAPEPSFEPSIELPPSLSPVTSPCEKREESQKRGDSISKKSKADNQDVVQTILNMPGIRTNMSRFGEASLRVAVEACQQRGITDQQMVSAVAERSFDGVRYLERALTARLEALEVRTPDVDTKAARCELHGHSDALHCPSCWGVVKAGGDPYEGREDQRPEGWHNAFAWSPSVSMVVADEVEVDPLNLPPAITAMLA